MLFVLTVLLLVTHAALLHILWLTYRLLAVLGLALVTFVEAVSVILLIKTSSGLELLVILCLIGLNWLVGLGRQLLE